MPGAVQDVGEVLGAVAGAVVGDDPLNVGDAVRGEPHPGAVHETDGGDGSFVVKSLGVGEPGESVDGGMQIDVARAGTCSCSRGDGLGLDAALAVHPPTAAVGD